MFTEWYKRIGYAFVLMMSVYMLTGIKIYATEETQLFVIVNPLYQEETAEHDLELESMRSEVYDTSDIVYYSDVDEAVDYVREQMLARNTTFTFGLTAGTFDDSAKIMYMLHTKPWEHSETCSGQEGDALLCAIKSISSEAEGDVTEDVEIVFNVVYHTTAEQEAELTKAVDSAMLSLDLDGKSDYEKVKAIYNYICDHVDYDLEHLDDETYLLQYTAYAAMVDGKAVCQGYAALFYRMCKEAGISVRVIDGLTSSGQGHAWNIVKVGDYYYNVDCTWDGQDEKTNNFYFLKSEEDFSNHIRNSQYDTAEFHEQYTMATESYYNEIFTTVNDTTILSEADGKPKVLIFFDAEGCDSQETFKSLQDITLNNVDIIGIDCASNSKEEVAIFASEYGSNNIQFCYDTTGIESNYSMNRYLGGFGVCLDFADGWYPVIVYVDANNKLQHWTNGIQTGNQIRDQLISYCGYELENENTQTNVNGLTNVDGNYVWYTNGVKDTMKTDLVPFDGAWFYVEKGELSKKSGFVDYDGETFYVADGRMLSETNGLVGFNEKFYFVAEGRVVSEYTGLAQYDGAWFYVSSGKMDSAQNGIVGYDGGLFLLGAGRIMKEVSGLAEDPNKPGEWYYVAGGQVQNQYTGLAFYDGVWFYVDKGMLDKSYTGCVTYDGSVFRVANGEIIGDGHISENGECTHCGQITSPHQSLWSPY